MIAEGDMAPDFTLPRDGGGEVTLSAQRPGKVVVFFYPKDDTPGCTKESCQFAKLNSKIEKENAVVLGVSKDSIDSHNQFIEKYNLPFTLLSDPSTKTMERYGAWGEKNMYGKITTGVIRSTVVIGPDSKVLRHWKRVPKAESHPEKVLEWLKAQE